MKKDKKAKKERRGVPPRQEAPSALLETYIQTLSAEEKAQMKEFRADFDLHCRLGNAEKRLMWEDFCRAILALRAAGAPPAEIFRRLCPARLGGFFARPATLWYPLDNAAKIYPFSMEAGKMPMFRLSAYMDAPVEPALLQAALHFTIGRFPRFATTLKKGFFWHYLDAAKRRYTPEQETDIPCRALNVSRSGSPVFRILYFENRISVEFFHILTDGTGGRVFLLTLVSEYLRLGGADTAPAVSPVRDVTQAPPPEESENAFLKVPPTPAAAGFMDKAALQLGGKLSSLSPCRILHFKIRAERLRAVAAGYGATVTEYLLCLLFLAFLPAAEERRGDFSIQVPVNMRKFYPSDTLCNFSMYCGIRIPGDKTYTLSELLPLVHAQLAQKSAREPMEQMVTMAGRAVKVLKFFPLFIKTPVAKRMYGFMGDRLFTTTLSNLGQMQLPPYMETHVKGMDFVLGTARVNRASCALITAGGVANLSITKNTADPSFEEALFGLLEADGLSVEAEGSQLYED